MRGWLLSTLISAILWLALGSIVAFVLSAPKLAVIAAVFIGTVIIVEVWRREMSS